MKPLNLIAVCALCIVPAVAFAQTSTPKKPAASTSERAAIYVNGGYQSASGDVLNAVTFASNLETARFTSTFPVKPRPAFDLGARVRVWKRVSVGVGYTTFSASGDATFTGQTPHPFFFNRPRNLEGTLSMEREEAVVHVRAVVTSPAGRKLQYSGYIGPAMFTVKQTLVDKINYSDVYPFDTVTFTGAVTRRVSKSKTGVGIGGDIAYYFMTHLGVGLSASYSQVEFDLRAADDSAVSIRAGGPMIGLGLRIRF